MDCPDIFPFRDLIKVCHFECLDLPCLYMLSFCLGDIFARSSTTPPLAQMTEWYWTKLYSIFSSMWALCLPIPVERLFPAMLLLGLTQRHVEFLGRLILQSNIQFFARNSTTPSSEAKILLQQIGFPGRGSHLRRTLPPLPTVTGNASRVNMCREPNP